MVSPISPRAIEYARRQATAVMTSTCRIERVQKPTYASDSLLGTPGSRTVIYEGPCRLWESSGGNPVLVAETDIIMQSTNLSIPWNNTAEVLRNDEVVMTAHDDPFVVGKRYQIQDSAKAGEMRATRRFSVMAIERPS